MIIPSKKKAAGIIVANFKPQMNEGSEMESSQHEEMDMDKEIKKSIAADIIEALHNKSAEDLMSALEAFFYECDKEPHEEGPHISDEV